MKEKILPLLERSVISTEPLFREASVSDSTFLVALFGIHRVSFMTLRDIYYLSSYEASGPSILDLTRKIIEHGIAVEYMLFKDKEKMAERFKAYTTVQEHEEFGLIKSLVRDVDSVSESLNIEADKVEKEYTALSSELKSRKTWAGQNFEGMLNDLKEAEWFNEEEFPRLLSAYIWGCRLNHPNPLVMQMYLGSEEFSVADDFYFRLGVVVAIASHLRIATRLIDESRNIVGENIYEDIAVAIKAVQDDLYAL